MTEQAAPMNGEVSAIEGRIFYGKPLVFRPGNHRYFWGGEPIPSVTTILGRLAKPALIQWAANMAVDHIVLESGRLALKEDRLPSGAEFEQICNEARKAHTVKKETAGDLGSQTHDYAQACLVAGELMPMPERDFLVHIFEKAGWAAGLIPPMVDGTLAGCGAFSKWYRKHKIEVIETERMVVSKSLHYAGRCDKFGKIDGGLGVLDFKTSAGIYPEFWMQLTAYEVALQEELQLGHPLKRWLLHLDKKTGKFSFKVREQCPVTIQAWAACVMLNKMLGLMKKLEKEAA